MRMELPSAAVEVFGWRDLQWWREEQSLSFSLRHPSRGWHRTLEIWLEAWEQHKGIGGWKTVAENRVRWRDSQSSFVKFVNIILMHVCQIGKNPTHAFVCQIGQNPI